MASVGFILEGFQKRSLEANNLVNLNHEQERAVNCLSGERGVFAVMPTGYSKLFKFQLFVTIKNVSKGKHSDTVVLVTCLLISITQHQVKERKSLSLDCVVVKDVKGLSNVASGKTQVLWTPLGHSLVST